MGQAASSPADGDPTDHVAARMAAATQAECETQPRPHVVISHAGEQKMTVADVIRARLREKHPQLDVFVDEWSLQGGDRAMALIGAACRGAAVGVVLLSPQFVRKHHPMAELRILLQRCSNRLQQQQQQQQQQHQADPPTDVSPLRDQQLPGLHQLLPVLYGLTVEDVTGMRALYDAQPWCVKDPKPSAKVLDRWAEDLRAASEFTMIREDQWHGLDQLADLVVRRVVDLLQAAGQLPWAAPVLYNYVTPPQSLDLGGRQEELHRAVQGLVKWRYVQIRGGPGEGKSTLAQHAMQQLCNMWLQLPLAEGAGKALFALEVDLRGLGLVKGLKNAVAAHLLAMVEALAQGPATQGTAWQVLQGWLRREQVGRVAILMENAEEGVVLEDFHKLMEQLWAMPNVYLIVATRLSAPAPQQVPPDAAVVELQSLGEAAGMQLVEAHLGHNHDWGADVENKAAAKHFVQLVEGNPLVLSMAARLVHSKQLPWKELVVKFTQHGILAINSRLAKCKGGMKPYMGSLQEWLRSCLTEEERRVLAAASLFVGSFTAAGAAAVNGVDSDKGTHDLLLALRDVSLVRERTVRGISSRVPGRSAERYSMHALVREAAARLFADHATATRCQQKFAAWMLQHRKGPGQQLLLCQPEGKAPDIALCLCLLREELQNFVAAATGICCLGDGVDRGLLSGAMLVGGVLNKCGYRHTGKQLQSSAVQAAVRKLGAEHRLTLEIKHHLATTLVDMGELDEARRLEEELLEARIRLLGPEHRDTLRTKHSLAVSLKCMRELAEARRLQEEVLEAYTRLLGSAHRDTLCMMQDLALTLMHIGEVIEARRLADVVLETRTRILGQQHPDTLGSKHSIAAMLSDMGELGEARRLQEQVLEIRTRLLGPEHPDTLKTKHSLAAILSDLGELVEAKRLEQEVLEARLRLLGPEHPETLQTKHNLTITLPGLGELGVARRLGQEVLESRMRQLVPEHPDTLRTKHSLALILRDMGELHESKQLLEEVLEVRSRLLGQEQPDTLRTKNDLASTLLKVAEVGEARRLQEEVLDAHTRLLGPEHPGTLSAKGTLAITLLLMGDPQGATRLLGEVLEVRTQLLGSTHTDTLDTKISLAMTLQKMGDVGQARLLLEEVLEGRARLLGAEHPATLGAKHNLAKALKALGEHGKVKRQLEEVVEARMRVLGPGDPDTLASKHDLGMALKNLGELNEALQQLEEVREARTRLLGPEHVGTLATKYSLASTLVDMGQLVKAGQLLEEVLEACTRLHGQEHLATLRTKHSLAYTLMKTGKLAEARQQLQEVLEARTRLLGPNHPDTLDTKHNLACTLRQIGELAHARRLAQEALEGLMQTLGPQGKATMHAKNTLGVVLRDCGELHKGRQLQEEALAGLERCREMQDQHIQEIKHELGVTLHRCKEVAKAKRLWEELLAALIDVLGPDHPGTVDTQRTLAGMP